MKVVMFVLALVFSISAMAAEEQTKVDERSIITSPDTFAVCKAADVATTAVALNSGQFVEANLLLKPFIGPGHFLPLVFVSVALWYVIDHYANKETTAAANVITCGVAAQNLLLIIH